MKGNTAAIVNGAVRELNQVSIEESLSALDVFNGCFRKVRASVQISDWHAALRAALMLYTHNGFYRYLNDHWRSGNSRAFLSFSTLMSLAFRYAKYYIEGEVYRGVNLADIDHYIPGLVFRWPFFVSACTEPAVAEQFGRTVVTIEVPGWANVRDIAYCSLFPEECEVLFPAYQTFEVLGANRDSIRLRVFRDQHFGTGWEINASQELVEIE